MQPKGQLLEDNKAREIMSNFGHVRDLERKLIQLDDALNNFQAAQEAYHVQLQDKGKIEDSTEYYQATVLLANDTRRIIDDWIIGFCQTRRGTCLPYLNPEDYFSNVG